MLVSLLDSAEETIVYPDDSGIFYLYFPRYVGSHYTRKEKFERLTDFLIKEHLSDIFTRPLQTEQVSKDLKKNV
jgi:hypothetical protein